MTDKSKTKKERVGRRGHGGPMAEQQQRNLPHLVDFFDRVMHGKPVGEIKEDPVTGWVYEDTSNGMSIVDLAELDPDSTETGDPSLDSYPWATHEYGYYHAHLHPHQQSYGQEGGGRWTGYEAGGGGGMPIATTSSRAPTPSYIPPPPPTPALSSSVGSHQQQTMPSFYPSWHAQSRQRPLPSPYANRYQSPGTYPPHPTHPGAAYQGYATPSRGSTPYVPPSRTPYASSHHGGMSGSHPHAGGYVPRQQMDPYAYARSAWSPPVPPPVNYYAQNYYPQYPSPVTDGGQCSSLPTSQSGNASQALSDPPTAPDNPFQLPSVKSLIGGTLGPIDDIPKTTQKANITDDSAAGQVNTREDDVKGKEVKSDEGCGDDVTSQCTVTDEGTVSVQGVGVDQSVGVVQQGDASDQDGADEQGSGLFPIASIDQPVDLIQRSTTSTDPVSSSFESQTPSPKSTETCPLLYNNIHSTGHNLVSQPIAEETLSFYLPDIQIFNYDISEHDPEPPSYTVVERAIGNVQGE
ncbi:hypothetical protein HK097_006756, partial [Rhizophlyctis rosea]